MPFFETSENTDREEKEMMSVVFSLREADVNGPVEE
jgi:hypothetical protein